jgi:hypothetical protein
MNARGVSVWIGVWGNAGEAIGCDVRPVRSV